MCLDFQSLEGTTAKLEIFFLVFCGAVSFLEDKSQIGKASGVKVSAALFCMQKAPGAHTLLGRSFHLTGQGFLRLSSSLFYEKIPFLYVL